ncbi:MAG: hypothetical protein HQL37_13330 [Alphaproteobacteria bacterium]|nr:hypothetical protein [Alphaproteobacteria bacterium]
MRPFLRSVLSRIMLFLLVAGMAVPWLAPPAYGEVAPRQEPSAQFFADLGDSICSGHDGGSHKGTVPGSHCTLCFLTSFPFVPPAGVWVIAPLRVAMPADRQPAFQPPFVPHRYLSDSPSRAPPFPA